MQKFSKGKILLISYIFPPYPGVGGKRWSKFAKNLAEEGFEVYVICCKNPFKETSLFMNDLKHEKIHVYPIPSGYPIWQVKKVKSISDKFFYKISLAYLKLFWPGNYYDKGVFWKKRLLKKSDELIRQHGIKNIIVTGAPFSVLHHMTYIKQKYDQLNLIGDLRDPWTWGNSYGFKGLSQQRQMFEKQLEMKVMEDYSSVLVPSEMMLNHLKAEYLNHSDKMYLLPHGFDPQEITQKIKKKSPVMRLMFYGTFYKDIEDVFYSVIDSINSFNGAIKLDVFSFSAKTLNEEIQKKGKADHIQIFEAILPSELFDKMDNYDYIIIFQPDYAKDYITTKIYEIIYSNTPIILVSSEGKLAEFIKENKLGIHVSFQSLSKDFSQILEINRDSFSVDSFPIANYSYSNLKSKITDLL